MRFKTFGATVVALTLSFGGLVVAGPAFASPGNNGNNTSDNCPNTGGGWEKTDNIATGISATVTALEGMLIAEVCYKAGDNKAVYPVNPNLSSVTITSNLINNGGNIADISHYSVRLVNIPVAPPIPCTMVQSSVVGVSGVGTAFFTIVGLNNCLPIRVNFSTYDLPGGQVLPFSAQVLIEHAPRDGVGVGNFYGPGSYTLTARLSCNWQADLYKGDPKIDAPHHGLFYLNGRTIGWEFSENNVCVVPPVVPPVVVPPVVVTPPVVVPPVVTPPPTPPVTPVVPVEPVVPVVPVEPTPEPTTTPVVSAPPVAAKTLAVTGSETSIATFLGSAFVLLFGGALALTLAGFRKRKNVTTSK